MEPMRLFAVRSWDLLWDTEPKFRRIWRRRDHLGHGTGDRRDGAGGDLLHPARRRGPAIGGLFSVTFVVLQVAGNVYFHRAGLYRLLGARWLAPGPRAA